METRMTDAERDAFLDSVSRAAGSIGHGINNLLTAVGGFIEIALQRVEAGRDPREMLTAASDATQSAGKVVAALLGFARRQRLAPTALDLASFVEHRVAAWRKLAGPDVKVVLERSPDTPTVRMDEGALDRAILALVENARDAIGGRGEIRVRARLDATGSEPRGCVEVADSGPGIPAEVRPHLFEPFVTTKRGQGHRGLGLAWVYGTIRQSGGDVRLTSEPGRGTTVALLLPLPSI
jgi:signal transduction histidine kinase